MPKSARKTETTDSAKPETGATLPADVLKLLEDASNHLGDFTDQFYQHIDVLRVVQKAVRGCGELMDDGNGLVDDRDHEAISDLVASTSEQLLKAKALVSGIQSRATEMYQVNRGPR